MGISGDWIKVTGLYIETNADDREESEGSYLNTETSDCKSFTTVDGRGFGASTDFGGTNTLNSECRC